MSKESGGGFALQGSDEMPFITACKVLCQISDEGALGESVL